MAAGPTGARSRAVQLGAELKEARARAKLSLAQVAGKLGYHHTTVSRWEHGHTMPSEADTASVCMILGITGEDRDRLIDLARHDRVADWVAPGIGKQLAALIEYERVARAVTEVNPLLIPGLLQTREYARSIMLAAGQSRVEAEQASVVRMGRQEVLIRRTPIRYTAIIGEQAIRVPPCASAIMIDQLHHLMEMSQRSNVSIQVLPAEPGIYTLALEGKFLLLEFFSDRPVVQLDSYFATTLVTNARTVETYRSVLDAIRRDAMNSEQSSEFIASVVKDMESNA